VHGDVLAEGLAEWLSSTLRRRFLWLLSRRAIIESVNPFALDRLWR